MDKTKAVSVLTDLIKINQERINAYSQVAIVINTNQELTKLFDDLLKQAAGFVSELQREITSYGLSIGKQALGLSSVYSKWKDFEITFSGHSARQLLSSCEFGEATLEAVYNSALEETGIPANAVIIILRQRREIKATHHKIKKHRDAQVLSVELQEL